MLGYFQRIAIVGVWVPAFCVAVLISAFALIGLLSPTAANSLASWGWGIGLMGIFLIVVAAHAMAFAALVGLALLVFRRSYRVGPTAISAIVGVTASAVVLGRLYFNLGA